MESKTNICRCCLEPTTECLEIFGKNHNPDRNIAAVLGQHFWFEITIDDQYSKLICTKCWTNVEQFHTFFMYIQSTHLRTFGEFGKTFLNVEILPQFSGDYNLRSVKEESELFSNEISERQASNHTPIKDSAKKDKNLLKDDKPSPGSPVQKKIPKLQTNFNKMSRPVDIKRAEEDARIREFFNIQCQECKLKFIRFLDLRAHYRKAHHIKRGYVSCCSKKFTRRAALLEHMCWHTNPDAFKCVICNKIYTDQYGLKNHMDHHASIEEKIFTCDVCGKCYSRKQQLAQHFRLTHFPEYTKIHRCKQCGKAFGLNSVLQAHIRGVHENANCHICDICAKVFKSKQQCQRHRQDHLQMEKPVKCTVCGALLKNDSSLRTHIRRIHEEQPQACKICGKSTPNRHSLRNHMKNVHEEERVHKCSLCDKSFKKAIALKEHMASHTGSILYTCTYCPKTFNSNGNKHSHRKRAHPEEWLRDRRHGTKESQ